MTFEQTDIFDEAVRHVHTGDPVTSYSAIEKLIESGQFTRQQAEVYDAWKTYPDTTARELARYSGLDYYMIQRRKSDLVRKNKLRVVGEINGQLTFRAVV